MPRGRKPEGETSLSNAERQARYRMRHKEEQPSVMAETQQSCHQGPLGLGGCEIATKFACRKSWKLCDKATPNGIPPFSVSQLSVVKVRAIATCSATTHSDRNGTS
jgi:hypothetical protein